MESIPLKMVPPTFMYFGDSLSKSTYSCGSRTQYGAAGIGYALVDSIGEIAPINPYSGEASDDVQRINPKKSWVSIPGKSEERLSFSIPWHHQRRPVGRIYLLFWVDLRSKEAFEIFRHVDRAFKDFYHCEWVSVSVVD